jgi:hypothetical protein
MCYSPVYRFFFQDDIDSAINLKLVLYLFEAMSGFKINFEKSEVLLIQLDNEKLLFYADLFTVRLEPGPSNIWGLLSIIEEQLLLK